MDDDTAHLAHLIEEIPLYAPVGEQRRARVSSTTVNPGDDAPIKVVVDFGSTPYGPDHGPDLEIATRRWERPEPPTERDIRGYCAERDLMERRMRDPNSAQAIAPPTDALWDTRTIAVDGTARPFTVLATARSWIGAAALPGPVLVRVFTPAPGPGPEALRRITSAAEVEPVRGRG